MDLEEIKYREDGYNSKFSYNFMWPDPLGTDMALLRAAFPGVPLENPRVRTAPRAFAVGAAAMETR